MSLLDCGWYEWIRRVRMGRIEKGDRTSGKSSRRQNTSSVGMGG